MATDKDFTPADWQRIEAAPFMAGLAIATRFAAGQRPTIPAIPNKPAEAQHALVDGCKAALALVQAKAPGEANAYATFVLGCAKAAANPA